MRTTKLKTFSKYKCDDKLNIYGSNPISKKGLNSNSTKSKRNNMKDKNLTQNKYKTSEAPKSLNYMLKTYMKDIEKLKKKDSFHKVNKEEPMIDMNDYNNKKEVIEKIFESYEPFFENDDCVDPSFFLRIFPKDKNEKNKSIKNEENKEDYNMRLSGEEEFKKKQKEKEKKRKEEIANRTKNANAKKIQRNYRKYKREIERLNKIEFKTKESQTKKIQKNYRNHKERKRLKKIKEKTQLANAKKIQNNFRSYKERKRLEKIESKRKESNAKKIQNNFRNYKQKKDREEKVKKIQNKYRSYDKKKKTPKFKNEFFGGWDENEKNLMFLYADKLNNEEVEEIVSKVYSKEKMDIQITKYSIDQLYNKHIIYNNKIKFNEVKKNKSEIAQNIFSVMNGNDPLDKFKSFNESDIFSSYNPFGVDRISKKDSFKSYNSNNHKLRYLEEEEKEEVKVFDPKKEESISNTSQINNSQKKPTGIKINNNKTPYGNDKSNNGFPNDNNNNGFPNNNNGFPNDNNNNGFPSNNINDAFPNDNNNNRFPSNNINDGFPNDNNNNGFPNNNINDRFPNNNINDEFPNDNNRFLDNNTNNRFPNDNINNEKDSSEDYPAERSSKSSHSKKNNNNIQSSTLYKNNNNQKEVIKNNKSNVEDDFPITNNSNLKSSGQRIYNNNNPETPSHSGNNFKETPGVKFSQNSNKFKESQNSEKQYEQFDVRKIESDII